MKTLYLECYSGISGDMTVAALLDLGASEEFLRENLEKLGVTGYHIEIGRAAKCGIAGCNFDVLCEMLEHHDHDHNHGHHDHDHNHGHHDHEHHDHDHHDHEHHDHEHHDHDHHDHEHQHTHVHRSYADICMLLENAGLAEEVLTLAKKIFQIVAKAESVVHEKPMEEVHFHEVGAVDSIVDIVATAACIVNLDISEVIVPHIYEGCGTTWCQHGQIPVPAPAVLEMIREHQLPLTITEVQGEMVTPTGAAIVAALRTSGDLPKDFKIEKIGIGIGKKDFPHANILRAMLLSAPQELEESSEEDTVWVLETNVDDCSGERLGYAMEELMSAGALDASCFPIFMKKNRPAYLLQVLCKKEFVATLEAIIFKETTSIGLRKYEEKRKVLTREFTEIETKWGKAKVKLAMHQNQIFYYPEYESVKELCRKSKESYQTIYDGIIMSAQKETA